MSCNPTDGNGENFGGAGAVREDGPLRHRIAMTLERRAMRENWPVPPEQRLGIIARQVAIATDPASSAREATLAFKAILAADSH